MNDKNWHAYHLHESQGSTISCKYKCSAINQRIKLTWTTRIINAINYVKLFILVIAKAPYTSLH